MYYANGNLYKGGWHKGVKGGQGKLHTSEGNTFEGVFEDGKKNGEFKIYSDLEEHPFCFPKYKSAVYEMDKMEDSSTWWREYREGVGAA